MPTIMLHFMAMTTSNFMVKPSWNGLQIHSQLLFSRKFGWFDGNMFNARTFFFKIIKKSRKLYFSAVLLLSHLLLMKQMHILHIGGSLTQEVDTLFSIRERRVVGRAAKFVFLAIFTKVNTNFRCFFVCENQSSILFLFPKKSLSNTKVFLFKEENWY